MREYLKLLKFVKPYVGLLSLAWVCMFFSAIFNGISLGMIVPLSDRVLTNKRIILPQQMPPFLTQWVDKLNTLEPMVILKYMTIFLVILFLLKGIFFFLQNYIMNIVGQRCVRDVRNRIYRKLQDLSMDFYNRKKTGELISRITNDVNLITTAISYGLTDVIYQSLQIVLFTFLVFYIYWKLALLSFVVFPLIILPVVKIGRRIKKVSGESQKRMALLNSHLAETIQGAYIVKSFSREDYEYERFKSVNQQYYKYMLKVIKRTLILSPFTEFVGAVVAVGILLIAGKDVIAGRLSFGVFGFFLGGLLSMIKPFKKLSAVHSINQQALSASSRIYSILEERPTIFPIKQAKVCKGFYRNIVFDGVWFKYQDKEEFVLKDINLKIEKNDILAIVGHSGAGKTTLVNLIPRFYDPQRGSILIDGVDIRRLEVNSLRKLTAIVSQDTIIFNDTIERNIAYGKEKVSWEEIEEAAKKAFAYDFITKLPQGFSTIVGDRGVRLSGGQKQRIAIARAFLKDAPILILDEATSHLDSESERLIQEAIYHLMEGKTVFVVAHRISTVKKATKIIVMEKGRIVEEGSHEHLLQEGIIYKRLYQLQFS